MTDEPEMTREELEAEAMRRYSEGPYFWLGWALGIALFIALGAQIWPLFFIILAALIVWVGWIYWQGVQFGRQIAALADNEVDEGLDDG